MSALLPVYERDLVLVSGKGARLFDAEGKAYLDFAAGIAVNGFGHGDRKIVAAIKQQASKLIHASNLFHTEPAAALADRLAALAFPSKVFFCNSGTEAWEGALKFARKVGQRRRGAFELRRVRARLPRTDARRSLDDVEPEVPRALRAARPGRALLPLERSRRRSRRPC